MGFEQEVPPVPTRQEQLKAIQRLQDSWVNQPRYKYYMNQAVRQSKMAFAERINKTRSQFLFNFAFYGLLLLPITYMTRRFLVSRGGLPVFNRPNYFEKVRTDKQIRTSKFQYYGILGHFAATFLIAHRATNWEATLDRNYEYVGKPVKYL